MPFNQSLCKNQEQKSPVANPNQFEETMVDTLSKRDISKLDVSKHDWSKRDWSKRDVTEANVTEATKARQKNRRISLAMTCACSFCKRCWCFSLSFGGGDDLMIKVHYLHHDEAVEYSQLLYWATARYLHHGKEVEPSRRQDEQFRQKLYQWVAGPESR